jgi:hypothetical protein
MICALISLNYTVIAFYIAVIIIQGRVKKSQAFINFANNILQVRKGLKSATVAYE